MDDASHWLPEPVIGAPAARDMNEYEAGAAGRGRVAGMVPAARRFLAGTRRRLASESRSVMWAAGGASDAELARLARRGMRLEIDDIRWGFVGSGHGVFRRWH